MGPLGAGVGCEWEQQGCQDGEEAPGLPGRGWGSRGAETVGQLRAGGRHKGEGGMHGESEGGGLGHWADAGAEGAGHGGRLQVVPRMRGGCQEQATTEGTQAGAEELLANDPETGGHVQPPKLPCQHPRAVLSRSQRSITVSRFDGSARSENGSLSPTFGSEPNRRQH